MNREKLLKQLEKKYVANCYESIEDLPILLWVKITEKNELRLLDKSKPIHISKTKEAMLTIVWRRMNDEYVKMFGFGREFLQIIRKQKQIARLKADMIITGDMTKQTFINYHESELQGLVDMNKSDSNFYESKASIEKAMGISINAMTTSVAEFYSYFRLIDKINKSSD